MGGGNMLGQTRIHNIVAQKLEVLWDIQACSVSFQIVKDVLYILLYKKYFIIKGFIIAAWFIILSKGITPPTQILSSEC